MDRANALKLLALSLPGLVAVYAILRIITGPLATLNALAGGF
jgi:hypothetical protein